jgi:hypothetical protein
MTENAKHQKDKDDDVVHPPEPPKHGDGDKDKDDRKSHPKPHKSA